MTAAFYSIVQFVPDPIADERVNIGVIVFSNGRVLSRFLHRWDRVKRFAQADIGYVQEFSRWIGDAVNPSPSGHLPLSLPGVPVSGGPNEETIRRIATEWSSSIQLTPPQPSLEDPQTLLDRLARSHLIEPQSAPGQQTFRDRQDAASLTLKNIRDAVARELGATAAYKLVRRDYPVGGRVMPDVKIDVAVANGHIYSLSQALSFETHDMRELERQTQHAIYTLKDISDIRKDIRLDVVVLPPQPGQFNYQQARERFAALPRMCSEIGAGLVTDQSLPDWARSVAVLAAESLDNSYAWRA